MPVEIMRRQVGLPEDFDGDDALLQNAIGAAIGIIEGMTSVGIKSPQRRSMIQRTERYQAQVVPRRDGSTSDYAVLRVTDLQAITAAKIVATGEPVHGTFTIVRRGPMKVLYKGGRRGLLTSEPKSYWYEASPTSGVWPDSLTGHRLVEFTLNVGIGWPPYPVGNAANDVTARAVAESHPTWSLRQAVILAARQVYEGREVDMMAIRPLVKAGWASEELVEGAAMPISETGSTISVDIFVSPAVVDLNGIPSRFRASIRIPTGVHTTFNTLHIRLAGNNVLAATTPYDPAREVYEFSIAIGDAGRNVINGFDAGAAIQLEVWLTDALNNVHALGGIQLEVVDGASNDVQSVTVSTANSYINTLTSQTDSKDPLILVIDTAISGVRNARAFDWPAGQVLWVPPKSDTVEALFVLTETGVTEAQLNEETRLRRLGDAARGTHGGTDAQITALITAQTNEDNALYIHFQRDYREVIESTVFAFSAGDLIRWPPRTHDWFRLANIPRSGTGGDGITEAEALALIQGPARAGSAARWPLEKLPTSLQVPACEIVIYPQTFATAADLIGNHTVVLNNLNQALLFDEVNPPIDSIRLLCQNVTIHEEPWTYNNADQELQFEITDSEAAQVNAAGRDYVEWIAEFRAGGVAVAFSDRFVAAFGRNDEFPVAARYVPVVLGDGEFITVGPTTIPRSAEGLGSEFQIALHGFNRYSRAGATQVIVTIEGVRLVAPWSPTDPNDRLIRQQMPAASAGPLFASFPGDKESVSVVVTFQNASNEDVGRALRYTVYFEDAAGGGTVDATARAAAATARSVAADAQTDANDALGVAGTALILARQRATLHMTPGTLRDIDDAERNWTAYIVGFQDGDAGHSSHSSHYELLANGRTLVPRTALPAENVNFQVEVTVDATDLLAIKQASTDEILFSVAFYGQASGGTERIVISDYVPVVIDLVTVQVLVDQPNIAWDVRDGEIARVTLGGTRTLDNPTNFNVGDVLVLEVVQDTTGGRTLEYGSAFTWPGGTPPTLSTGAGERDILTFLAISPAVLVGGPIIQNHS